MIHQLVTADKGAYDPWHLFRKYGNVHEHHTLITPIFSLQVSYTDWNLLGRNNS